MKIYEFKFREEIDYVEDKLRKESIRTLFKAAIVFLIIHGVFLLAKGSVMFKVILGITILYLVVGNFYFKDFYSYAAKKNKIISFINWVQGGGVEITTLPSKFIFDFKPKIVKLSVIVDLKEVPEFIYTHRGDLSKIPEGFGIGRCFRIETLTEYFYLIFDNNDTEAEIQDLINKLKRYVNFPIS